MNESRKTFLALDNLDKDSINELLKTLPLEKLYGIKIGLESFYKHGRPFITELKDFTKLPIFLDLKLHDIPNTVAKAIKSLNGLPVDFLTVHLTGGEAMLRAALKGRDEFLKNTKIIGVSYLTSLDSDDFNQIWGAKTHEQTLELMKRSYKLGLDTKIDGIVLSANELQLLQEVEKEQQHRVLKICPGIRFSNQTSTTLNDQKRVCSPSEAIDKGADFLVIGRPLQKNLNDVPKSFWQQN